MRMTSQPRRASARWCGAGREAEKLEDAISSPSWMCKLFFPSSSLTTFWILMFSSFTYFFCSFCLCDSSKSSVLGWNEWNLLIDSRDDDSRELSFLIIARVETLTWTLLLMRLNNLNFQSCSECASDFWLISCCLRSTIYANELFRISLQLCYSKNQMKCEKLSLSASSNALRLLMILICMKFSNFFLPVPRSNSNNSSHELNIYFLLFTSSSHSQCWESLIQID